MKCCFGFGEVCVLVLDLGFSCFLSCFVFILLCLFLGFE
jgi:hypothetical protein